MPVLPDARYEKFAQCLAKGDTAIKAYTDAGFKPHRPNAARLSTNDNIKTRVAEILGATAKQVQDELVWDAKSIFKRILRRAEAAAAAGDHKAAIDAEKFIAECFGYKDSPTLTHEHVNGKPMMPVERQPQEGEKPRVVRFASAVAATRKSREANKSDWQKRGD
jgi:hypothetical protein